MNKMLLLNIMTYIYFNKYINEFSKKGLRMKYQKNNYNQATDTFKAQMSYSYLIID